MFNFAEIRGFGDVAVSSRDTSVTENETTAQAVGLYRPLTRETSPRLKSGSNHLAACFSAVRLWDWQDLRGIALLAGAWLRRPPVFYP